MIYLNFQKIIRHILRYVNHNFATITFVPIVLTSSGSNRLRSKVTLRAIFRDVADILFPFGGIFRHGDTSINICAAGTGDHVTRPSATICERGHVRHSELTRARAHNVGDARDWSLAYVAHDLF